MMKIRTTLVGAAVAVLVLVSCGSDDTASGEPTTTDGPVSSDATPADSAADEPADDNAGETPVDGGAADPVEAPDATLPADLPEEFAAGFAPVDVVGDWLPLLETEAIDDDPALGSPVPVLIGYDMNREPVRIDPATDGATMVVFLAHWCPHCNDEIPVINELRDAGELGVNVVAVATASNPERDNFPPDTWLEAKDWTYPAMFDGVAVDDSGEQVLAAMSAYGGNAFPFVALVDADGNLAARWAGSRSGDEFKTLIADSLGAS